MHSKQQVLVLILHVGSTCVAFGGGGWLLPLSRCNWHYTVVYVSNKARRPWIHYVQQTSTEVRRRTTVNSDSDWLSNLGNTSSLT